MAALDPKLLLRPRQRPDGMWYIEATGPDSIPRTFGEFFEEWQARIWILKSRSCIDEQERQ